jgi:poly(3-hydroxyoctanoate) depolymerase
MGFKSVNFKGLLFLILLAVYLPNRAHGIVTCSKTFAKNSIVLNHGEYKTVTISGNKRELLIFQPTQPLATPAPVMIYFHGTDNPVETTRPLSAAYGLAFENAYIQGLTDAGFVVIAPTSNRIVPYYVGPPVLAWEANIFPYASYFERGRDYQLIEHLLKNIEDFSDVPVDPKNIFLSGFSSGGYMSSRLAQNADLAKLVRGIVVHSASYGECLASQCYVPPNLPAWHPQTLLVANKDDSVVPFYTVELYQSRLKTNNIPHQTLFSADGDHAWKENHGGKIIEWLKKRSRF